MGRDLLITCALGFFIVLMVPGNGVDAGSVDLTIVATFEDRVYEIGEVVHVQIQTFKEGRHFTPRDLDFVVGSGRSDRPKVEEVSEGHYEVNYTIKGNKLTAWGSSSFLVRMNEDGQFAMERYFVRTVHTDAFRVRLFMPDPDDDVPLPGQRVEFEVRATYHGEPINLDFGSPRVLAGPHGDGDIDMGRAVKVPMRRTSTGVYAGEYRIPSSVNTSTRFDIDVAANCTIGDWVATGQFLHALDVNFLNIWIHVEEVGDTTASVGLIVTDLDGNPATEARVNFAIVHWSPWFLDDPPSPRKVWEQNQTVDEMGRAFIVLDRPEDEMSYLVTVRYEGNEQVCDGSLILSEWGQGGDWSSDLMYANLTNELPLRPDEEVLLEYEGRMYNGSFALEALNVLIIDAQRTYWEGPVNVDEDGRFSIPITTPKVADGGIPYTILNVRFNGLLSSDYYHAWKDSIVVYDEGPLTFWDRRSDPEMDLTVLSSKDDRSVRLSLSFPGADGTDEKVSVLWGIGYPYSMADFQIWRKLIPKPSEVYLEQWRSERPLVYGGEYIWATCLAPCVWDDGSYSAEINVPEALPEGLELYFLGVVERFDDIEPRTALITVTLGESAGWPTDGPDDGPHDDPDVTPDVPGNGDGGPAPSTTNWISENLANGQLVLIVLIVSVIIASIAIVWGITRLRQRQ